MKKSTERWMWVTAAFLLLTGTALLFAQNQTQRRGGWGPGMGPGMGQGMMGPGLMGRMAQYLQLTDAQKAQIKTIWEAEKPTLQPLMLQLANGHKQMMAVTANGAFDQAKVASIATQQSQTMAQLIVEKEKLQSQIYNQVLTPEQRTKLDDMRQKQSAHIDQWLQHMDSAPIQ